MILTTRATTDFAALIYLASFALAQNLTFIRPQFSLSASSDGQPQLVAGQNVTVEWSSEFERTTLVVYQEVERNLFQVDTLAQNARPEDNEVQWQAGPLPGSDGLGGAFHFELTNSNNPDCSGCSLNSDNFVVVRRNSASSTTSSSASQTAPSTDSIASSTVSASPTAAVAGAESTTSSSPAAASVGSDDRLRIGLGVGLGVGIPLILAIVGAVFFLRRRREKRRNSLPRGRQPSPAQSPDRASGAWLYQDGRQSQQSMLFRPSTAARSEVSSWSHRSWIEPFEFEQVEMREQDAMSQLRRSFHGTPQARRSQVSLDGIPEVPQIVHDGRWSR